MPINYNVNNVTHNHNTSPAGTHSHSLSGSVGNSASGVTGDQAMTSRAAGPSYITLNYIIRAT